ncbi:hypothetical protein [Actinokineospora inagensis]|uniref:hypothetical protein n=1 Tax=Actinokineospora inagensis TaxID=103730 RepID=UPI00040C0200|nr:hypothetical protein [Actinokineospora inagensis]
MDEHKISELFNDAVRDVPPPSFDRDDVLAASAKATRRRTGVIAGAALGLAVVVGGVAVGVALWPTTNGTSSNDSAALGSAPAVPGNANPVPGETQSATPRLAEAAPDAPSATPKQGGSPGGEVGLGADSTPGGCGPADRKLAAALAGELPSAVSPGEYRASPLTCAPGSTSAAFQITRGPERGLLSIMVTPKGKAQVMQPPWADRSGAQGFVIAAKSGATVVLEVESVSGSAAPPITADGLRDIGKKLAGRY